MDQALKHKTGRMIIGGFPSPYVEALAEHIMDGALPEGTRIPNSSTM